MVLDQFEAASQFFHSSREVKQSIFCGNEPNRGWFDIAGENHGDKTTGDQKEGGWDSIILSTIIQSLNVSLTATYASFILPIYELVDCA
jgi:hypothetical protein